MVRRWISEIQKNTAGMDRKKKAQYIAEYYWAHFLLLFLAVGAVLLGIYNFTLGKKKVSFECAIVNTATDDERDRNMESQIAKMLDLQAKDVRVDSAYRIAFDDEEDSADPKPVTTQKNSVGGSDYAGYDKFFFAWGNRELDAVIMPESFLHYCEEIGGELNTIGADESTYILLSETKFADEIEDNSDDPMVIVFPKEARHEAKASVLCEKMR